MAWYGWSLALTGKLAPMLSGFINVGMGWEWTLYWCAIWNAMCFVYCFLFLEETNYDRKHNHASSQGSPTTDLPESPSGADDDAKEKNIPGRSASMDLGESAEMHWPRKTFLDKLSIKDKKRPNRLMDIFIAPFKGFT